MIYNYLIKCGYLNQHVGQRYGTFLKMCNFHSAKCFQPLLWKNEKRKLKEIFERKTILLNGTVIVQYLSFKNSLLIFSFWKKKKVSFLERKKVC